VRKGREFDAAAASAQAVTAPAPTPQASPEWAPPMDEVLRYCRSKLPSSADAEDAAQETLLRAWALRDRGDQSIGWFIKTASYVCSELRRRNQRFDRDAATTAQVAAQSSDPERLAVSDAWLCQLFDRLSPQDRALLSHLYLRDGSPEELAARLGLSPGGTRMAAMRARQRARNAIGLIGGTGAVVTGVALRGLQKVRDRLYRLRGLNPTQMSSSTMNLLGETPAALLIGTVAVVGLVWAPAANLPSNSSTGASFSYVGASTPAAETGRAPTSTTGGGAAAPRTPTPEAQTPSPASTSNAAAFVQRVVAPGQHATPQQANMTSFTPSPNYGQDHTVFASGVLGTGCSSTCNVLFETNDSGKTWRHLPAAGYLGFQVMLSPTFPSEPSIYATYPGGIQMSSDGGATFLSLLPQVTVAAPEPSSSPGDTQLLLGEVPLVTYHVQAKTAGSGPVLPPGVDAIDALEYAGSTDDLLVAAKQVNPLATGQQSEVILQCTTSTCTTRLTLPAPDPPTLVASPSVSLDRTVIAFAGNQAWISQDGGGSFEAIALPAGNLVQSVAIDPAFATTHTLGLATLPQSGDPAGAAFLLSHDGGATLATIASSGLPAGSYVRIVTPLPGGPLFGAPWGATASARLGVWCSTDWGAHWGSSC
jgi:RNA polymerase sigma factor (sigma-70 family)